ncbi:MAG: hypothetical protein Q8S31_03295 [Alphaproteobacteria bacterium]|nr:hypothetical protein [Alphaproteobacteria bacterium]
MKIVCILFFIIFSISKNSVAAPLNLKDYEAYISENRIHWPENYTHRCAHDEWRIDRFKKLFIEDPDTALKNYLEKLCTYWARTDSFYLIPHHIETFIIFKNCFEKAFQGQPEQLETLSIGIKTAIENLQENHLAHYLKTLIDYPDLICLAGSIEFDIEQLFKLTIETAVERKDDQPIKYLLELLTDEKIVLPNKDQYIDMLIKYLPLLIEKKPELYCKVKPLLKLEQAKNLVENPILTAFIEGAILRGQDHLESNPDLIKDIFNPNPTDNPLNYAIKRPQNINLYYEKFKEANTPLFMRYLWNGLINNSHESYADQNNDLLYQQICDYFQIDLNAKKQNILENFWFIYLVEIQKLSKIQKINLPETINNNDCNKIKELLFSFIVPTESGSSVEHIKTELSTITYDLFKIKLHDNDRDFRKKLFDILLHFTASSAYEQQTLSPQSLYLFFRDTADVPFAGFYTLNTQLWYQLESEFVSSQEIELKQRVKAVKDRVHFLTEQKNLTLWDNWQENMRNLHLDPLLTSYADNMYEAYRVESSFERCSALRRNIELQQLHPDLNIMTEWNFDPQNLYRAYSTKLTKELNNINAQVIDELKHCKVDADANALYGIELDILDNNNLNFYTCNLKDGFAYWFHKFEKNDISIEYEDDIYKHFQYCFDQKNIYLLLMKNESFKLFIVDKKTGKIEFSKKINLPPVSLKHMNINNDVLFIIQETSDFEDSKKSFLTLLNITEDISNEESYYLINQKIQEDTSCLNFPDCKIYNNYLVLYNKLSTFIDESAAFRVYTKNSFLVDINVPLIKVNDEIMWYIIDDIFIYKKTTEKNECIYRYINLKKKNKIEFNFENHPLFNQEIDEGPKIKSHIVNNASRNCIYLNEGQKIKIIDLLKE